MDVVFISSIEMLPINVAPQLGQFSLWNILKNKYECIVINFDYMNYIKNFDYDEKIEKNIDTITSSILKLCSRIVGFYTISSTYHIALEIAQKIKSIDSGIIILFGGPLATLTAKESLEEFDFIDCIALGESELYIEELIDKLLLKKSLAGLNGIAYKDDNGRVVINSNTQMIQEEKLPDYTVYEFDDMDIGRLGKLSIDAGRGCPFNCSFCSTSSFWGRKFRIKKPQQLINEMNYYYQRYGICDFSFSHDMFTVNKTIVENFCDLIMQNNIKFTWGCSSRIDALDKKTLKKMALANCQSIYIGIESGSARMQNEIGKNLDLNISKDLIEYADSIGIQLTVSFIYGLPNEDIACFYETIDFIEWLLLKQIRHVQLHLFMPLPKTKATDMIYEDLYLDYKIVDISILNPNNLTLYMKKNIENLKKIFCGFYTFDSDVRNNYKKIDVLLLGIADILPLYKFCLNKVIKEYGLIKLYERYTNNILSCAENLYKDIDPNIEEYNDYKRIRIYDLILFILYDLGFDKSHEEIFKFETELFELHFSKNDISYIKLFPIDVVEQRENGNIIKEPTMVRFYKKGNKERFSKLAVELISS